MHPSYIFKNVIFTNSCESSNIELPPVIESVRITDPQFADSTFTSSRPGKMIVIQGRNLARAKSVFINDQRVKFNPNMNTDHSIIVSIPSEINGFVLTAWDESLRPEIRVVTNAGEASYAFKVLAPSPSISRIAGRYPREEGDTIMVVGNNFLDVTAVYFSESNPLKDDNAVLTQAPEYKIMNNRYLNETQTEYITDSEMRLVLPSLDFVNGYIVVASQQGRAVYEYAALPPAPVLKGISSDMPVMGSRVRMRGEYFIDVTGIKIGDELVVKSKDMTVSEDESELSFIMPIKPEASTTISVLTPGGESNKMPFYRYETVILNFDNMGKNLSWDPDAKYPVAQPEAEPYISDNKFALFDLELAANLWWGIMIYWESSDPNGFALPGYDVIPADTSIEDVYLLFECYSKYQFTKYPDYLFRVGTNKDYTWNNRNGSTGKQIRPEFLSLLGDQPLGEWYTAAFPLSTFTQYEGFKYSDFVDLGLKRIRIMLKNQSSQAEQVFVGIDNMRISTLPTYSIADETSK